MATSAGAELRSAPETAEVTQRVVADEDHVATTAPVAAIGAATGDVSLAAKAEAAVAAGSGLHMDARAILH
jgi:hypothetical protein